MRSLVLDIIATSRPCVLLVPTPGRYLRGGGGALRAYSLHGSPVRQQ